jgi:hypothetical protein
MIVSEFEYEKMNEQSSDEFTMKKQWRAESSTLTAIANVQLNGALPPILSHRYNH